MNDGAVLFCEQPKVDIGPSVQTAIAEIGYAPSDEKAEMELTFFVSPQGMCLRIEGSKALALALARKVALRIKKTIRVCTASALQPDKSCECAVDDLLVRADGSSQQGTWGTEIVGEFGENWSDVCDDKPYFAVTGVLDLAIPLAAPDAVERRTVHFAAPRSLGNARLDDIALQVRLATRAQLSVVGGRQCVRITSDGTTVTSFVDATEAAALRNALGDLLPNA